MPKLDLAALPEVSRTGYLPPYDKLVAGRRNRAVGGGLTDFGANIVTLAPGAMSSMRHWHSDEDELVVMLSGEAVLIDDAGESLMRPGDVASFAKGVVDGHHLVNRSTADAVFLAVGTDRPATDRCTYPDVDMFWSEATGYVPASALGGG
ncbi:cupin domain-containing protein [Polymorphobacter sp. PAMC 29334]|uniref:cupin domain-containing protein n=1 Tax=Polymorphobacter sp. PAMC 29334 TaxID=2862331 RepID=UPI001C751C7C|nr:cupin domain-containing protein [Polymorphobacter sp. PAMC 29334]QYE35286.1 cupin domain-containing protein [Polymorphobacter sp. PAMC 29334]